MALEHFCSLNHCRRCGECISPPRTLCNICRKAVNFDSANQLAIEKLSAKTCFGWAVVESPPIKMCGSNYEVVRLRLTENSFAPNKEILAYPVDLIEEYEE